MAGAQLEIIKISDNREGWRQVTLALDGQLACPLDVTEERFRSFRTEEELHKYLKSQAETAIRAFGDFRNIRRREDGQYIQVNQEPE